jgi:peptide/nickel transport system substrate-binding protein
VAINLTYVADPEIAKWLTNRDFRRALSLGIDRDQLNEVFWMGVGTPGSPVVGESHPYNPGPEYRKLWSTYDPKKANEMLDRIGLATKDAEGYRLRTDGKGRLRLGISTMDAFIPGPRVAEMIREHWRKIGIEADVKELERSLFLKRRDANETPIELLPWGNTGSEVLWTREEAVLPGRPDSPLGPEYGKWYASGGTAGLKPTDPQMLKVMELFRSAAGLPYEERVKVAREIWRIAVDEQWTIGTVGLGPAVMGVRIVKNNMGNVPERLSIMRDARVPGGSHPETYFFKTP